MAIKYLLGEIGEIKGGISSLDKDRYDFGILFINYMDVFKNASIRKNEKIRKYDANEKEYAKYSLLYGDAIFTASSETSNEIAMSTVFLLNEPAIFNGFSKRYRFNHEKLNPQYASYLFRGRHFREEAQKYATGYTRFNISQSDLLKIEIEIPPLEGQQKIIDIIEPIEKLQDMSLFFLNKIVRFCDNLYKISAKREIIFSKIASIQVGGTPPTNNKENWMGETPWIDSGKLTNSFLSKNAEKFISFEAIKMSRIAKKNDILVSIIEPDLHKISIARSDLAVNQSIAIISCKVKNIYFEIKNLINYLKQIKSGAAQQSVNKGNILNSKIFFSNLNFDFYILMCSTLNRLHDYLQEIIEKLILLLVK